MKKTVAIKNTSFFAGVYKKMNETSFTSFSIKDQTFFVKRLSFLVKAGIPILESLHMIREQTRSKGHNKIYDVIIEDVSNGKNLSTSLSKFKKTFGEFAINIISFGESSGILSENLEYLADELKKRQLLKKKIIGAFIYPAVVTVATLGITGFLMIYLFPKIMPIFSSIHMELPLSTKIIIFLSNFIKDYGLVSIITLTILIIITTVFIKRNKKAHFYFDKYTLKLPIVGNVIRDYNLANCNRTIGLLLRSGITVSEAIFITTKTTLNSVYKKEFSELSSVVNRGEKMSSYLRKKRDLFTDVMPQVVSVGEKSGNLSSSLIYLSEMYEAEVDDFTKNISGLIEPILMVFMGVIVGFVAISIITPIYGITQHLQPK
jgi:type IV pilus assembly protein PilC